jgi:hypothetical protein
VKRPIRKIKITILVSEKHCSEGREADEKVEHDTSVGVVRAVVVGADAGVALKVRHSTILHWVVVEHEQLTQVVKWVHVL